MEPPLPLIIFSKSLQSQIVSTGFSISPGWIEAKSKSKSKSKSDCVNCVKKYISHNRFRSMKRLFNFWRTHNKFSFRQCLYLCRFKSFLVKNFLSHWPQTNFLSKEPFIVLDPACTFRWVISSSWGEKWSTFCTEEKDKDLLGRGYTPMWENSEIQQVQQHCLLKPKK